MATTQPFSDDGKALVLYRSRQLSEVTTVSTVAELIAAVSDGTVDNQDTHSPSPGLRLWLSPGLGGRDWDCSPRVD